MTIIDFRPNHLRDGEYARLASASELELVYPYGYAPSTASYDWVSLPLLGVRAGRRRFGSLLPLKSALKTNENAKWIAVEPSLREATQLLRWANRSGVALQLWLDETQSAVWLWYVIARAAGAQVTAEHWRNGLREEAEAKRDEAKEAA